MFARYRIVANVTIAVLLATLVTCSDSSTAPSPRLDLTGTWMGHVGQPASTSALGLTWVATHNGNVVSGIATLVKPVFGVQARGR
jgi:hypothetical protein